MAGQEVYVVGGGNSAGQAALHLARYARQVTLLVRGPSLAASMSEYLIAQLEATRNVALRYGTAVLAAARRTAAWPALTLGDPHGGPVRSEEVPGRRPLRADRLGAAHAWLPEEVERDEAGFVRTGRAEDGDGCRWRPACRVSSPSATCAPGRSSGSRPPSATARR